MKRFFLLDIYRIAIVFVVLLFHLTIHFRYTTSFKFTDQFIISGAFAMTCFFMLSGALLSSLYSKKDFFAENEPVSFYKKRFAKIYPLYIVFLLLALFIRKPVNWWVIPMQIVPLQAFFPQTFNQFMNGGVWFISDLLFAYLLFPFLNFLLEKTGKNLRTAFLIVWGLIVYFTIVDAYTSKALYVSPAVRTLEFMAGMICERLASQGGGGAPLRDEVRLFPVGYICSGRCCKTVAFLQSSGLQKPLYLYGLVPFTAGVLDDLFRFESGQRLYPWAVQVKNNYLSVKHKLCVLFRTNAVFRIFPQIQRSFYGVRTANEACSGFFRQSGGSGFSVRGFSEKTAALHA